MFVCNGNHSIQYVLTLITIPGNLIIPGDLSQLNNHQPTMSKVVAAKSSKPLVMGGKLKLKGSSSSSMRHKASSSSSSSTTSKEQSRSTTVSNVNSSSDYIPVQDYLTEAQKKHNQKMLEKQEKDAKKLSSTSFRDRIDQFNSKLSRMTEHNDIPRISAAGNG